MPSLRQQPDGSWAPAEPEPLHPGFDVERTFDGRWTVYRTTRHASLPIATGQGVLSLWIALWKARLFWPVRPRHERGGRW